jgi:hypothetical protein
MQGQSIHERKGVVNLTPAKYEAMRDAVVAVLPTGGGGMLFEDMVDAVTPLVPAALFPHMGGVNWYAKSVQLDLEAKRVIERVPGSRPLRFRKPAGG